MMSDISKVKHTNLASFFPLSRLLASPAMKMNWRVHFYEAPLAVSVVRTVVVPM
jgi:hypothetical protein